MTVRDLLKKLKTVDPRIQVRIAGWRLASGVDHAYDIAGAKVGGMIDDDFDGPVVCRKNARGARQVFLIREDA